MPAPHCRPRSGLQCVSLVFSPSCEATNTHWPGGLCTGCSFCWPQAAQSSPFICYFLLILQISTQAHFLGKGFPWPLGPDGQVPILHSCTLLPGTRPSLPLCVCVFDSCLCPPLNLRAAQAECICAWLPLCLWQQAQHLPCPICSISIYGRKTEP